MRTEMGEPGGGFKWFKIADTLYGIVVINVYKRFFLFFYKNAFLTFFLFFQRFLFKKTFNCQCENNSNLKHLCTKTEKNELLPIK